MSRQCFVDERSAIFTLSLEIADCLTISYDIRFAKKSLQKNRKCLAAN